MSAPFDEISVFVHHIVRLLKTSISILLRSFSLDSAKRSLVRQDKAKFPGSLHHPASCTNLRGASLHGKEEKEEEEAVAGEKVEFEIAKGNGERNANGVEEEMKFRLPFSGGIFVGLCSYSFRPSANNNSQLEAGQVERRDEK